MGTCETVNRKKDELVVLKEGNAYIDATDFYDIIVPIRSIKDITNGWKIKLINRFKYDYTNLIKKKQLELV